MSTGPLSILPETAPDAIAPTVEALVKAVPSPPHSAHPVSLSAADAREQAVNELTQSAYRNASLLKLTQAETEGLYAEFPDDAFRTGAGGKENLIYIEHAYLRERLNKVLGVGQWAIMVRSRREEPYEYYNSQSRTNKQASRVYVEAFLLIRGCWVAESFGDMTYYPDNQLTNYGDAVEGAKSAALRRCAKELGVGLQAWKKDFVDGWWHRKGGGGLHSSPQATAAAAPPANKQEPSRRPSLREQYSKEVEKAGAALEKAATAADASFKLRMLELLTVTPDLRRTAEEYAGKAGIILPGVETLEDWPMDMVPTSKVQMDALTACIRGFEQGEPAAKPFPPHPTVPPLEQSAQAASAGDWGRTVEAWRALVMPFGRNAGRPLGELDKNYLWGLWLNFKVEVTYNGKPREAGRIEKDQALRVALDEAAKHYDFKRPKGEASDGDLPK